MSSDRWQKWLSDPEHDLVATYAKGNGIDVCCGSHVFPGAVGIDMVKRGEPTDPTGENISQADIVCDAYRLPFKDATLDFVISSHGIEHLNAFGALKEWARVLLPGGHLCLITPDSRYVIFPDTGPHGYEPENFALTIAFVPELEVLQFDTLHNHFTFDCIARKV